MRPKTFLSVFYALIVLATGLGASQVARAADPTMHEIYTAVDAGEISKAQRLIGIVLQNHPDSAKAHFVAAEVDVRAGDRRAAERELSRAEALSPGLGFATPESVRSLKAAIAGQPAARASNRRGDRASSPPWGAIALGLLVVAVIGYAISRRRAAGSAYASGGPYGPAGTTPAATPMPGGPAPSTGSGLMGSLATGAAIGAGVVAGEALAHRVFDDREPRIRAADEHEIPPELPPPPPDFGIADQSWDDGNVGDSGGGDDWS